MIWHAVPRQFDPFCLRIQHVIEFLIQFLQSVVNLFLIILRIFQVSKAISVPLRNIILLEKFQSIYIFLSYLLSLHVFNWVY